MRMARFHAGVNSLAAHATSVGFTDEIFDDAIQEFEAEAREAREERQGSVPPGSL